MSDVDDIRRARKAELVQGYHLFAQLGWGDLGDGHISARDPEQSSAFWMLADDVPFREATADALVLLGEDGRVIAGPGETNWPGYRIHQPIIATRSDVVSVVHTHTQWGTPFSALVQLLLPITQEACCFFEEHSIFDDEEVQVLSLAAGGRIAAALGALRGLVLRNHGLLTVGGSVGEAVAWFVMMERVAEATLKAPGAKPISPAAARRARADLAKPENARAMFRHLVRHHLPAE